jgi:hypothetical protein
MVFLIDFSLMPAFFMDLINELREFSVFPGRKMKYYPRSFTNIARINWKTHGNPGYK